MKSTRSQLFSEQRARILEAARFLFGSGSFDDVTMAEVGRLAGVARATVFNYFRTKHALADALTSEVFAGYEGMLERALALEKAPTPLLVRALFAQMGSGIEQFYRFHRGMFREIAKIQLGLDAGSAAAKARARAFERLRQLLARGQERGEIRGDVEVDDLASAFDAIANGTIHHWLYDDTTGSLRARMERAAEIFLGPVAADGLDAAPELVPDLSPPLRAAPRPPSRRAQKLRAPTSRRKPP